MCRVAAPGDSCLASLWAAFHSLPLCHGRKSPLACGEIDFELGGSTLRTPEAAKLNDFAVEAGQERRDQILAYLALRVDEVHGALGNPQGGELVIVHHGLKPFPPPPAGHGLPLLLQPWRATLIVTFMIGWR